MNSAQSSEFVVSFGENSRKRPNAGSYLWIAFAVCSSGSHCARQRSSTVLLFVFCFSPGYFDYSSDPRRQNFIVGGFRHTFTGTVTPERAYKLEELLNRLEIRSLFHPSPDIEALVVSWCSGLAARRGAFDKQRETQKPIF